MTDSPTQTFEHVRNIMDNKVCGMIGYHEPYGKDATRFYYGEDDPKP